MDNLGLIEYCKEIERTRKTLYMWGGLMNPITEHFIKYKAVQYPNYYSERRKNYLRNYIDQALGCDCVGLIKSYYFGGVGSPNYDASKDLNASGMYNRSSDKGPIETLPETYGIGLYQPGHVGVYAKNGEVYECTLGAYGDGVVKTQLAGRGWTHWFKVPFISYVENDRQTDIEDCNCECGCGCCADKKDEYDYDYTVQKGDSFWKIAKMVYGDGTKYTIIMTYNNANVNTKLYPGDILKIPVLK